MYMVWRCLTQTDLKTGLAVSKLKLMAIELQIAQRLLKHAWARVVHANRRTAASRMSLYLRVIYEQKENENSQCLMVEILQRKHIASFLQT